MYALDPDHALELAGNGADTEFESPRDAAFRYDPEVHQGRKLFRILVEEVKVEEGSASN
jgi:hypothetical protein